MRHTFSAEFLRIVPPATNFGEAWENLCLSLLRAETSDNSFMRLAPPDCGIDLLRRSNKEAYQCKSNERGVLGTIDADQCIQSLQRALQARQGLPWTRYVLALNAPLTAIGLGKFTNFAVSAGLDDQSFSILSPEYWEELCERHRQLIEPLFDYRVFLTESEVVEALKKARYYDEFVQKAIEQLRNSPLEVSVGNNRTPVELVIPFSGELSIRELLDVVKNTLGISLAWANFPDLGTSCGPSISITVDRRSQSFDTKLADLTEEQRAKLQFWIKLIWRDELQRTADHYDGTQAFLYRWDSYTQPDRREQRNSRDRGQLTLERMNAIMQATIWESVIGTGSDGSESS